MITSVTIAEKGDILVCANGGGRYMAFISWPFQRENTPLGRAKNWGEGKGDDLNNPFPGDVVAKLDGSGTKDMHPEFGRRVRMAGASEYLRTQAVSRLYLDNLWSIGASWVLSVFGAGGGGSSAGGAGGGNPTGGSNHPPWYCSRGGTVRAVTAGAGCGGSPARTTLFFTLNGYGQARGSARLENKRA